MITDMAPGHLWRPHRVAQSGADRAVMLKDWMADVVACSDGAEVSEPLSYDLSSFSAFGSQRDLFSSQPSIIQAMEARMKITKPVMVTRAFQVAATSAAAKTAVTAVLPSRFPHKA